jgi:tyrosine-specific transport protein
MLLKNTMGGVLLIAGTAIGAAVLALPIQTAALGFTYSLTALVLCWGLMTIGALLVLEANLLIGQGTNLITMAQRTLGPVGQMLTWLSYLFLF